MTIVENAMVDNTNETRKTRAEVISELQAQGKLTAEEVEKLTDVDVITIGGIEINFGKLFTLVDMYDKAIADDCTNEDGNCTNKRHLHIGDYVDYKNPTSGSKRANATDTGYDTDQIYEISKNDLNWRVLGKDSTTGGIKLISGRPMKSNNSETDPYLHLNGAKGYLNSETLLNDLCSLYTTQYGTARSVNRNDVNEITGVTTEENIKQFNKVPSWGGKQYGDTYSFENQYTPQSWINGKQQTIVSGTVFDYVYTVNSGNEPMIRMTNIRAHDMVFNNILYNQKQACFWLASCSITAYASNADFNVGDIHAGGDGVRVNSCYLFNSMNGNERDSAFGVRPVILLKSSITQNEIPKIADKTEETWNYSSSFST